MQSRARFIYLFERYRDKTYTHGEKEEFMSLLRQPAYDALLRELLRRSAEAELPGHVQPAAKADAIFGAIIKKDRSAATTGDTEKDGASRLRRLRFPALARYAAAAVVAAAIALGITYHYSSPPPAHSLAAAPRPPATAPGNPEHRYVILPDGSKVLLNSHSHLDYPPAFSARREVYLQGEGYFDIRHDPDKPFIVHTGGIKTVVLGTAFNIRAYPGQENVVVTVTKGKVRVENSRRTLGVLTRNEQMTVNDKTTAPARQVVKPEEAVGWKADDIIFDDIPLAEAARELEKHFSIRVTMEDAALGAHHVSASFIHHEKPREILQVLCGIAHLQYKTTEENSYTLYQR